MSLSLPIQRALLGEALLNIAGASAMIFMPNTILSWITSASSSRSPDPTASQLLQWLGVLFYGLTAPMLLALPNGLHAGAKRRNVYVFLLCGELFLIPMMLAQAFAEPKMQGGITSRSLLVAAANLTPFAALRSWVLVKKAGWFVDGTRSKNDRRD